MRIFCILFICLFVYVNGGESSLLSSHWLLKLNTDDMQTAHKIAAENNFVIKRQVGSLKGYFIVESIHHKRMRRSSSNNNNLNEIIQHSAQNLNQHPLVESFEQEKLLKRNKRDFIELPVTASIKQVQSNTNVDPFWKDMWYMNRHNSNADLPDLNITSAWSMGYSGKGVSVTFLDDGLEWDHPDIMQNYDPKASTDINGRDDDPMPRYDATDENKHGTRCAGEVAAVANNSICSVGIAFNSGIGGIRMLDGDVTDSVEAASLSFNPQHVHIYSASWGPDDNGEVVDGPGPLAKKAFMQGANTGRNGLGSIFVWASGNGGRFNDSCACDGYANSIYTLSISSTSENSEKPWYLEECASTLATTYSSGDERHGEKEIITTDIRHKCTVKHTGTSAAAPIAAGIIALALEANPKLTWRDVMYIIVLTSRAKAIKSNNYVMNKRGLLVSSRYGFGLMDAGRMVQVAKNWKNVPQLISCSVINSQFKVQTVQKTHSLEAVLTTNACQNTVNEVNFIEQVEIIVTVKANTRGLLEIYLISPMGTKSIILPRRPRDTSPDGFKKWAFMSVQQWGEDPRGDWTINIASSDGTLVELEDYELVIHGTKTKPVDYEKYIDLDQLTCNSECSSLGYPCGPTVYDCQICAHFKLDLENEKYKCVSYCPSGYFADFNLKKCVKCHSTCLECNASTNLNCTSCPLGSYLNTDTFECVSSCPTGYFINSNNECEHCASGCATCQYESTYCLSCIDLKEYDSEAQIDSYLVLKENMCILVHKSKETCTTGTFFDFSQNDCKVCDINCAECISNTEISCTKCSDKRRPYLMEGRCVDECEMGYYLNETLNRCIKCDSNCKNCSKNSNMCFECKETFTLNNKNQCIQNVFYESDCADSNCLECFGKNKNQCFVCKNGLFILNGECVSKVPDGYYRKTYKNSRGFIFKIEKCIGECSFCAKDGTCLKCSEGFHLIGGECFRNCDTGFYPTKNGLCIKCEWPCEKCLNETYCLSCQSDKILYNGKCLQQCPLNYFSLNSVCTSCHPSCETCTGGDKLNCITCSQGFEYLNKECKSKCPDGTYFDSISGECSLCNSTACALCIKTPNTCTKCASSFALDQSTFTCKPCCSRSLRGKIKYPACCNCGSVYTGVCSIETDNESTITNEPPSNRMNKSSLIKTFLSFLFLALALVFIFYSIVIFKRSYQTYRTTNFNNVEYSILEED